MRYKLPGFEVLREIALASPDALERFRQQLSEAIIRETPPALRRRLRGLQFRIDMEQRRAKSPMAACIAISGMMHDNFEELRHALNEAAGHIDHSPQAPDFADIDVTAKVLPFMRKA